MLAKTKPRHTNDQPVRPRVAVVLAGGLLIVTAFQAALTFGAPLGAAAQRGTNPGQLPDALRLVTAPPRYYVALRRFACAGQGRLRPRSLAAGRLSAGDPSHS